MVQRAKRNRSRGSIALSFTLCALPFACGEGKPISEIGSLDAAGSGGTTDAGIDPRASEPCETPPVGDWVVTYASATCEDHTLSDDLHVASDGTTVSIAYSSCDTTSICTRYPVDGCCQSMGTFAAATCSIEAISTRRTTSTGPAPEPQCDTRRLELFFRGDTAEGTLTRTVCWCGGVFGTPVTVVANARRP